MTSSLILESLAQLWTLIPSQHTPAVVGGLAMTAWKHPRYTQDVDFLIAVDPEQVDGLIAHLKQQKGLKLKPRKKEGMPTVLSLGPVDLVQFLYTPTGTIFEYQIDLLVARADFHRQALKRTVTKLLPGMPFPVQVASCEDLILLKLLAGRAIDDADARHLLSGNRAALDGKYLVRWAKELGVETELIKAWSTALPGQPLPNAE